MHKFKYIDAHLNIIKISPRYCLMDKIDSEVKNGTFGAVFKKIVKK